MRDDAFVRRRPLIAACVGGAAAEAVVLSTVGPHAARAMAAQLTAAPPLGIFHDLRWLAVYHDSWVTFAVGVVAVVAGRSCLDAALLRAAWPAAWPRPSWPRALASSLAATCVSGLLLAPMVTLLFGTAVVPFSWPYLAAVPGAFLLALFLPHAGAPAWWRRLPSLRAVAWLAAGITVMTASGLVADSLPPAAAVLPAAAGGLFNAWAWFGLAAAAAGRPAPRRRIPLAPLGATATLVLVIVGAHLTFVAKDTAQRVGRDHPVAAGPGRPVLVVGGFGSGCCYKAGLIGADTGLVARQFSYRGLDARGRPIPHGKDASTGSLDALAASMALQVRRLHHDTGRPVAVVAESEGSMVTLRYLTSHPRAPVNDVVLLSPIVDPGRVSYPARGEQGWGVASGYGLRGLLSLVDGISPFRLSPDGPLLRSIDAHPAALALPSASAPHRRVLVVLPLADALTMPSAGLEQADLPVRVVPAFHGGLLGDASVRAVVVRHLRGDVVGHGGGWGTVSRVVAAAGSAWRVPPLVGR